MSHACVDCEHYIKLEHVTVFNAEQGFCNANPYRFYVNQLGWCPHWTEKQFKEENQNENYRSLVQNYDEEIRNADVQEHRDDCEDVLQI